MLRVFLPGVFWLELAAALLIGAVAVNASRNWCKRAKKDFRLRLHYQHNPVEWRRDQQKSEKKFLLGWSFIEEALFRALPIWFLSQSAKLAIFVGLALSLCFALIHAYKPRFRRQSKELRQFVFVWILMGSLLFLTLGLTTGSLIVAALAHYGLNLADDRTDAFLKKLLPEKYMREQLAA